MSQTTPIPANVCAAYDSLASADRTTLLTLRDMIFDVARTDPLIGGIAEELRWGEPAYLTHISKSGSTIRLGVERNSGKAAIFFNCKTTLVEEFRQQFGTALAYSKNRAILLTDVDETTADALRFCIGAALSYHLRGKAALAA